MKREVLPARSYRLELVAIASALIALASMFGTGCTANRAIVAMNVIDATLFACDATQTYSTSDGGKWDLNTHEGDPIQGTTPSVERIYGLAVVNTAINVAISLAPVPKWLRLSVLGGIGARTANTVNNNREFVGNRCGV